MAKYSGTLHWCDLEGGFWELSEDSGARHQLAIDTGRLGAAKNGDKVDVDADDPDEMMMGIGMIGGVLVVKTVSVIVQKS